MGDRVLRVEVEVLDDERTSTPAVFKDLGRCLTLPAAALCRLVVVIGVICPLTGSSELSVGDRVLRVEVEVLDDERTSTPAVFKVLGRCLTLPAAALRRLIVVIGVICSSVWRASI